MTKMVRPALTALLGIVTSVASLTPASATESATSESSAAVEQVADRCGTPRPFGDICYFYGPSYGGAQAGFASDVPDLLSPIKWLYPAPGAGAGQQVAHNARAIHNRNLSCAVTIYSNPGYTGPSITLSPGASTPSVGSFSNRGHYFHSCR